MIESFRHKGLQRFFEADDGARLPPDQLYKIGVILSALDVAAVQTICSNRFSGCMH